MQWKDVWSYTQQDYRSSQSLVDKQIQIIRIRSNHNTNKIKVKFSNIYGFENIKFSDVIVKIYESDRKTLKSQHNVSFDSDQTIVIPCKKEFLSDEITTQINKGDLIEFESILSEKTVLTSGTVTYCREELELANYEYIHEKKGNFLEQKDIFQLVKDNNKMCYFYGVAGVEMFIPEHTITVVAFGDSLTQQGFWIENLKKRFFLDNIDNIAVLNRGIGGSRILKNTNPASDKFQRHGLAGIVRFNYEIPQDMKIDHIIVFHGINDLITKNNEPFEDINVEDIISGLIYYAKRAKTLNSKVYISTLLPLKESIFFNQNLEKDRLELNEWIRNQRHYDGVIDFEKVVLDYSDKSLLNKNYDSGDGLHLSNEGGKALAYSIDYNIFYKK